MPPNEDPKAEQLSQAINAEIERKVSERLKELQERLDQRVQETMRNDREFVKDTIGVAFKIAGFAVAVVVIVLGALGWKTFGDVYKTMTDTAAKKSEEHFSGPDGKRIIDSTLDHAVLDSYLVHIALMNANKAMNPDKASYQELPIDNDDANRLLRIINDEKTPFSTFESAAKVLILAFGNPYRSSNAMLAEVGESFADLITAKGKDQKWIESNHQKRLRLLQKLNESHFSEDQVKSACRDLLSSPASIDLRRAAVTYLGTIGDEEALDKLVDLVDKGKDLRLSALTALAKVDPTNGGVLNWIRDLDGNPTPSIETVVAALEMSGGPKLDPDTRSKLVDFAARHCRLTIAPSRIEAEAGAITPSYLIALNPVDLKATKTVAATTVINGTDGWSKAIDGLLRKYAQDDLNGFGRIVRWLMIEDYQMGRYRLAHPAAKIPMNPEIRVKIMLKGNSVIKLDSGDSVDNQAARGGVILSSADETGKTSEQVMINWVDAQQDQKRGILSKFESAEALSFKRQGR